MTLVRLWTAAAIIGLLLSGCSDDGVLDKDGGEDATDAVTLDVPTDGPTPPSSLTLEMTSTIERTLTDGTTSTSVVTLEYALERTVLAGSQAIYEGAGTARYQSLQYDKPGCETVDAVFVTGMSQAQFVFDAQTGNRELFFDPGVPIETVTVTCDGMTGDGSFSFWRDGWEVLHGPELHPPSTPSGYPFLFEMWGDASGLVAEQRFEREETIDPASWSEVTLIQLR